MPARDSERERLLQQLLAEEEAAHGTSFAGPRRQTEAGPTAVTSFAQERLWFVDQMLSSGEAYNIPHMLRLRGVLDVTALAWALDEVVRRHEVLRTTFPTMGGRPVQRVHPPAGPVLRRRDLSAAKDPEAAVRQYAAKVAMTPFDLASDALLRAELVALAHDDHVLLLTMHHIVSDGWSTGVLVREMTALYAAHRRTGGRGGSTGVVPPLPVQYSDYGRWQRELHEDVYERQLTYWADRLAGLEPVRLPTDRARPETLVGRGETIRFDVPDHVRDGLRALAEEEGATLFMVLMAGFGHVLHRLSGQSDLGIGTYLANRQWPQVEALIGYFVNTIVLRVDAGEHPSFRQMIGQLRDVCLTAYENQDVPFEQVVQRLSPDREQNQLLPLYNVDCMLQNAPRTAFDLDGVDVEVLDQHTWTSKSDLGMIFWEGVEGSHLVGWCEFNTELFDRETAERIAAYTLRVLEAGVRTPDTPLSGIELLSDGEREQQVTGWCEPAPPVPHDRTVLDVFARAVARRGAKPAVVGDEATLTFDELDRLANAVAWELAGHGAGPEDRVLVIGSREPETLAALVGVLKSGAAFVTVDPDVPPDRWAKLISDADPVAVVCTSAVVNRDTAPGSRGALPPVGELPVVVVAQTSAGTDRAPEVEVHAQQLAYVMYTSGSTGAPKGAMIEHRSLVNLVEWLGTTFHRGHPDAPTGCFNPDLVSDSFIEDFALLLRGGTMYLVAADVRRDPRRMVEYLRTHQVEYLGVTPTQLAQLVDSGVLEISSLRRVRVAGEAFPQHLWDRAAASGVEFWNGYGPTECTVDSTAALVTAGEPVSIGRPVRGAVARVVDGSLGLLPVGVRGELGIGGMVTGRGYLADPRRTAERFVPDPWAAQPGGRMYRSGDVVSYRRDGELQFYGRRDDQVKVRGHRVELGEIAAALRHQTGVTDAHVELVGEAGADQYLVAYVAAQLEVAVPDGAASHVASWRDLFDVEQAAPAADVTFNTAGWNDSATLAPIAAAEMSEFRDAIVGRILDLSPRSVLELGCGTGLILYGLGPHVDRYSGVDLSPRTIEQLRAAVSATPPGAEVELLVGEAADPPVGGTFDAVVLNSVAQYFPDTGYLERVLRGAAERLAPGGSVVLGDLRTPHLSWATHAWIELSRARPAEEIRAVAARIDAAVAADRELAVSHELLAELAAQVLPGAWVDATVHGGFGDNELVRFRYDVTICGEPPQQVVEPVWLEGAEELDVAAVVETVRMLPDQVAGWRGVPNRRLRAERALAAALRAGLPGMRVSDLDAAGVPGGVDPQEVQEAAARLGWTAKVSFAPGRDDGALDVVLLPAHFDARRTRVVLPAVPEMTQRHSDPTDVHRRQRLQLALRRAARQQLPEHMVPDRFVVVDRLPTNPSGKVDRARLPDPDRSRLPAGREALSGTYEVVLGRMWCDLLGVSGVAADADFFGIGGHSLLAASLVNRINDEFRTDLSIQAVFRNPVLRELARAVQDAATGASAAALLLPALRDEYMPLSGAQERMLAVETLGGVPAGGYTMHHCLRIRGQLDQEALRRAVTDVVRRHEILRTRYVTVDGQFVQQVLDEDPDVRQVDLSGEADPEEACRRLVGSELAVPFDLGTGGPLRVRVVRLGATDHVLVLMIHHIASDAWSTGVALRELVTRYEVRSGARAADPAHDHGALPVQYADYAVWHREWLTTEKLDEGLAFWRRHLAGAEPTAPPGARAVGAPQGPAGGERRLFDVGPGVWERVERLAALEGVTPFMVVLAAFAACLAATTGRTDLVVGTVVAGRQHAATEGMVGFFVNPLPVRIDCGGVATYRELLERTRGAVLASYAYQHVPYDQVVRALADEGTGRDVFEILLQVDDASPDLPERLGDARLEDFPVVNQSARYPFAVTMSQRGGWSNEAEYRLDRVDRDAVTRFLELVTTALDRIGLAPDIPLATLTEKA